MPGSVLHTLNTVTSLILSVVYSEDEELGHNEVKSLTPGPSLDKPWIPCSQSWAGVADEYLLLHAKCWEESSPAKMLLHQGLTCLWNALELSALLFNTGREGRKGWRSCCLASEHRKVLLRLHFFVTLYSAPTISMCPLILWSLPALPQLWISHFPTLLLGPAGHWRCNIDSTSSWKPSLTISARCQIPTTPCVSFCHYNCWFNCLCY